MHPNAVLCSDALADSVSFYAQFELAPTFKETCGPRYLNATYKETFIRSQDLSGGPSSTFSKYSMCMYEVFNPYPGHTMYLNVYRKTNHSDIGVYYQESKQEPGTASNHRSPLMPRGSRQAIQEYVAGGWEPKASIPVESEETVQSFHTFKVQYPAMEDLYFDMSSHMKQVGGQFHNVSDIIRQYSFEGVDKINVVVIGQSAHSQFDFGVQVGLFKTSTIHAFEDNWGWFAVALLIAMATYFIVLTFVYGYKSRKQAYSEI